MSTRHDLPGGQWADVIDLDDLSGADQDAFLDRYDELIQGQPQPQPQPDPANPAQMLPVPPRTLGRQGNRAMEDWIWAKAITGWSLDLPLPWRGEHRTATGPDGKLVVPARTLNALRKAAKPVQDVLVDDEDEDGPKSGEPNGSGGSADTSRDDTQNLPLAPPAVTSGTP